MRKFTVLVEWKYGGLPDGRFIRCTIRPATQRDEPPDAIYITDNSIDGGRFELYPYLEEAILDAGFNPSYYTWSYKHGLQITI